MTLPSVPPPGDIRRPVIGKLKKGWTWDKQAAQFVGPRGKIFDPHDQLPPDTHCGLNVPILAKRRATSLSPAEKDLLRYIQILLPQGVEPEALAESIAQWPCFESAVASPRFELP